MKWYKTKEDKFYVWACVWAIHCSLILHKIVNHHEYDWIDTIITVIITVLFLSTVVEYIKEKSHTNE